MKLQLTLCDLDLERVAGFMMMRWRDAKNLKTKVTQLRGCANNDAGETVNSWAPDGVFKYRSYDDCAEKRNEVLFL